MLLRWLLLLLAAMGVLGSLLLVRWLLLLLLLGGDTIGSGIGKEGGKERVGGQGRGEALKQGAASRCPC